MDPASWSDDELVVVVALVRSVIHADHQISAAEQDTLAALHRAVGADRWNRAVRAARVASGDAPAIDRIHPAHRAEVHAELLRLAGADGALPSDCAILRRVADAWGLPPTVDRPPER